MRLKTLMFILTSVMYCSIIRSECHSVARIFKRDYNAFLPIGAQPEANLTGGAKVGVLGCKIDNRILDRWFIGAWRSPASALAWGARGRRFKSSRPDRKTLERESFYSPTSAWRHWRQGRTQSANPLAPTCGRNPEGYRHIVKIWRCFLCPGQRQPKMAAYIGRTERRVY
jgi:hypothetical protein